MQDRTFSVGKSKGWVNWWLRKRGRCCFTCASQLLGGVVRLKLLSSWPFPVRRGGNGGVLKVKGEEYAPGIEGGARERDFCWLACFPPSLHASAQKAAALCRAALLSALSLRQPPEGQPGCSPKGVRNQLQACPRGRQRMGWGGRESQ